MPLKNSSKKGANPNKWDLRLVGGGCLFSAGQVYLFGILHYTV